MKAWLLVVAATMALGATMPAFAQDRDVIVVTGSRIQSDDEYESDFGELPYVSIVVDADFVLFTVSLESPTNNVTERDAELGRAYNAMVQRVGRTAGVELEIGDPGGSIPPETATADEIIRFSARRSSIPLVLKFDARPTETFPQVRARAEEFIRGVQVSGRVEAVTGPNQYIGVRDPAKHRADLLRKIAEDTRQMQDIFASTGAPGALPGISLVGLGGRVKTRPVGAMEIEMFIPYSIVLGAPLPQPPPR